MAVCVSLGLVWGSLPYRAPWRFSIFPQKSSFVFLFYAYVCFKEWGRSYGLGASQDSPDYWKRTSTKSNPLAKLNTFFWITSLLTSLLLCCCSIMRASIVPLCSRCRKRIVFLWILNNSWFIFNFDWIFCHKKATKTTLHHAWNLLLLLWIKNYMHEMYLFLLLIF